MSAAQVSAPCLWADCQRPTPSAAATCRGRAPRPFPIPSAPGTARVSSLNLAGPKGPASFDDDDSHPDLRAGCDGKAGFSYDRARAVARQMRRTKDARLGHYHCRFCGRWHVGERMS